MHIKLSSFLAVATAISAACSPAQQPGTDGPVCDAAQYSATDGSACITPHSSFSSSIGVLGCKIDTNRVAYWPTAVSCDDICVRVQANGKKVTLLKIDQSGGAWDISYDAWNILKTGQGALEHSVPGGGIMAAWENVPMSDPECLKLLKTEDGTLPLTAWNSMNYVSSCLQSQTWVGKHYSLYNIADPICTIGYDERCEPPAPQNNQPTCPHGPGAVDARGCPVLYQGPPVKDIQYPDGTEVIACGTVCEQKAGRGPCA